MKKYSAKVVIPKSMKISYIKALGEARDYKQSGMGLKETDAELIVEIETGDPAAMRAQFNSLFRDIQVIEGAGKA